MIGGSLQLSGRWSGCGLVREQYNKPANDKRNQEPLEFVQVEVAASLHCLQPSCKSTGKITRGSKTKSSLGSC
jgi:hypothetical protein